MIILGINAYHPDSSAALVIDGKLVAACEEERFRRIKHFAGFPQEAVKSCLIQAGISLKDVDYITIPRNVWARFFKKVIYGIKMPKLALQRISAWGKTAYAKETLSDIFSISTKNIKAKLIPVEHHRAHLASSFFISGFNRAFLFSADALGDFGSTMWGIGDGNNIKIIGQIDFPNSLGLYYTAITQYLGFLKFGDEYKVMGLAAYGEPSYKKYFEKILKLENNTFKLGLEYFVHHKSVVDMEFNDKCPEVDLLFSSHLERMLGKRRQKMEPLDKRYKDIAATLQKRLEEAIFYLLKDTVKKDIEALCISGGVGFNCVVNGKIFDNTAFKKIYVPAASGDAGLAIGSAFYFWNQILGMPRSFEMKDAYTGPEFSESEIELEIKKQKGKLDSSNYTIEKIEDNDKLCYKIAEDIATGKIIGWFQGRMEWGPRALGNRSILADPRRADMKDILNKRIKHRESFRPFAPSITQEDAGEYFEHSHPSPFMTFTYKIKEEKKKIIPAVCHVNGTARLQTVNKESNRLYWGVINSFKKITGIPVLLNTSFNENEPIVSNPCDAIECFLRTRMDVLAIGPFIIRKKNGKL